MVTLSNGLLGLPPEILERIAICLDSPSVITASCTCRALQSLVETRIYSVFNTVPRSRYAYRNSAALQALDERVGEKIAELEDVHGELEDGYDNLEWDFWFNRYSTEGDLEVALNALQSRPLRSSLVRHVRICVIDGLLYQTMELLKLVQAHMETLEVIVYEDVSAASFSDGLTMFDVMADFYQRLRKIGPFPELRTFIGKVNSIDLKDIDHVFNLSPVLQNLELDIAQGYESHHDNDSSLVITITSDCLKTIKVLRLLDVEAHFMPFIIDLVVRMPILEALAINSLFDTNETISLEGATILRQKKGLWYLEWVDGSRRIPKISNGTELLAEGFADVEVLMLGCPVHSSLRMNSPFGHTPIPTLPSLRHVQFPRHLPRFNLPASETIRSAEEFTPWSYDSNLNAAQRLLSIRCIDRPNLQHCRDPLAWQKQDIGVVIRSYTPPNELEMDRFSPLTVFLRVGEGKRTEETGEIDARLRRTQDEVYFANVKVPLQAVKPMSLIKNMTGQEKELDPVIWQCVKDWLAAQEG